MNEAICNLCTFFTGVEGRFEHYVKASHYNKKKKQKNTYIRSV